MMSGLKSDSYQERCAELKLETLEKRRTNQDLVLTHKMLTDVRFRENGVLKQFRETGADHYQNGIRPEKPVDTIRKNRTEEGLIWDQGDGVMERTNI